MKTYIPQINIDIINNKEYYEVKDDYNGFYCPPNTIVLWYDISNNNKKIIVTCCDEFMMNDIIDDIINTVNHEYMHHILYHLEGDKVSDDFDNLFMYMSIELDDGGDE